VPPTAVGVWEGHSRCPLPLPSREWEYWPCPKGCRPCSNGRASSPTNPHDRLSIKRCTDGIPLWPMDLPSRLRICSEAGVDGGIVVRLRRVVGVVGGLGRGRLALVGQHSNGIVEKEKTIYCFKTCLPPFCPLPAKLPSVGTLLLRAATRNFIHEKFTFQD
jgi:hypothetical protein